jgi:hypothetical protein
MHTVGHGNQLHGKLAGFATGYRSGAAASPIVAGIFARGESGAGLAGPGSRGQGYACGTGWAGSQGRRPAS